MVMGKPAVIGREVWNSLIDLLTHLMSPVWPKLRTFPTIIPTSQFGNVYKAQRNHVFDCIRPLKGRPGNAEDTDAYTAHIWDVTKSWLIYAMSLVCH